MVKVKICGLDGTKTCAYLENADWGGVVVFSPLSRRNKDLTTAREIFDALPSGTKSVAVTVSSDTEDLELIAKKLEPDVIQLHSRASQVTWFKKLAEEHSSQRIALVHSPLQDSKLEIPELSRKQVEFVVLDTTDARGYGGTGRTLNWNAAAQFMSRTTFHPILLAGGLTSQNVAEAIAMVKPDGVDVSSGVERNGKKDPRLIRQFINTAKGEM